ncbi:transcription termination factor 1 [Oxyura jamaicensis]|uniref:transcription termination factor 1 n=1 Tax=Oxyura jamaicensis TaxID=8884 RepID=UPI0015A6E028|nr:transcription termination factor 1 [Oxyura jamaicensis]XP_035197596.1 transcription termination factor 1 [Oxyura jamaicensis]
MTEEASAEDFQVGEHLKKKKKKRKDHDTRQEDDEKETIQDAELFEGEAAECSEIFKKKKKKKKKKKERGEEDEEEQRFSLSDSHVGLELEVSNEPEMDVPQKKKKKKKHKHDDSTDGQSDVTCISVNQHCIGSCQEDDADYIYVKKSKKKRKKHHPEEDRVSEQPTSETQEKSDNEKPAKKKRRVSCTEGTQEDTAVPVDQSLLPSPEQNRQEEDAVLPSPMGEGDVAVSTPRHEDGDCDASSVTCEASVDVPGNFSKSTEETNQSSKRTPARSTKFKSKAFITDESSSDSDTMTPRPTVSKEARSNTCTETVTSGDVSLDGDESLDSITLSLFDLDTAKQELEEFIPHVRQISEDSIKKMAGRDLMRFKEFKKQGIPIKFGRFSQKENDQIRKNIEEFMAITGIDSAEKLLFTSRYPEEKNTINRLKARHLFCEKLAEGIPRAWRLIYYRARKMFDSNNYKGRYTKEEKEKLKKYHALHGNDWKKISEMMSRSNLSVAMKYSEIKSPINYGPWSKEETQKLMRAVEEVFMKGMKSEDANSVSSSEKSRRNLLIEREKLFQKLPWNEIEAKVGTRYWRQCKQKWTSVLTNKITKGQQLYRGTRALQAKINLIKRLYEMKVEDADEVNWEELSGLVGGVPKEYVRARFYKLKVSYVPLWQKKTFSEIIDYLFEEKLPEFEEKLESRKGKQLSSDDSTDNQQRKVFRFSDVFDSSEESDDSLKNN